jgi:hypothetical protein
MIGPDVSGVQVSTEDVVRRLVVGCAREVVRLTQEKLTRFSAVLGSGDEFSRDGFVEMMRSVLSDRVIFTPDELTETFPFLDEETLESWKTGARGSAVPEADALRPVAIAILTIARAHLEKEFGAVTDEVVVHALLQVLTDVE